MTTSLDAATFQAIVAEVKSTLQPRAITLRGRDGSTDTEVLVLPPGLTVQPTGTLLEPRPSHPDRREGCAVLTDLNSFIAHVNRFRDADSALFADDSDSSPGLMAVLDYHQACHTVVDGEDGPRAVERPEALPRFGVHRARYAFPLADEFTAWREKNGEAMSQAEFAAFLENRALDLLPPPDLSRATSDADKDLQRLTALLRGRWAGPEVLMDLSRGLAVHAADTVVAATNLSSGEGSVIFESKHETTGNTGERIEVPNLFCIGVPIFKCGEPWRIAVRLRYRKAGNGLVWFYEMYQADKVFRQALDEALDEASTRTGLPLLRGQPEPTPAEPPRNFAVAR